MSPNPLRRAALVGLFVAAACVPATRAQNDVMMQAFYWDVPVNATTLNGTWWDNLAGKALAWSQAGITGIWVPPPSKGNFGIYDMGYGIYDHYDLGNYNQKGTTETRFGSRSELVNMMTQMRTRGIEVYADIVLNHIYTNDAQAQANPAVKTYFANEAFVGGQQRTPYPTNEVLWRIPNAAPGDYYIKIKGYALNWSAAQAERAYDLYINWTGAANNTTVYWESEPNNGGGQFNTFPGSGRHIWAHIGSSSDVDEYKVTVTTAANLDIRLESRREVNGVLDWASQENGYRVFEVWHNGTNLAATTLQARTNTSATFPNHTGTGEANFTWTYTDFHPVDQYDFLGNSGFEDSIEPNWKLFGQDFNTFSTTVQNRQIAWGQWLANTIKFDGYRLDFVRGFQEEYVAKWVNNMPRKTGGAQRFVVGEYFTGYKYRLKSWVNNVYNNYTHNGYRADVDAFDFPLKNDLTSMANGNGSSYDMRWLNHAGMVRDNTGNSLPGTSVVTFVDNHDTGKEHDKWVSKDWRMAYGYILFAEGRPCLFYPHYYAVQQVDQGNSAYTTTAPSALQTDIKKLMHVRKNYLGGAMTVLSQLGNPYPSGDAYNVYVARRQGNGTKTGGILVINNHDTQTKGLWVDTTPSGVSGYANWSSKTLINALDGTSTTAVQADGRVYVSAPARGIALYVPQTEFTAFTVPAGDLVPEAPERLGPPAPSAFALRPVYPNPFAGRTTVSFDLPEAGPVAVRVFDALGREVAVLSDEVMPAGTHTLDWDAADLPRGVYTFTVRWNGQQRTGRAVLLP
jgi:alpha-amylase